MHDIVSIHIVIYFGSFESALIFMVIILCVKIIAASFKYSILNF